VNSVDATTRKATYMFVLLWAYKTASMWMQKPTNTILQYSHAPSHRIEVDALVFLQKMIPNTRALIEKELNQLGGVKFTLVLTAELEKLYASAQKGYDEKIIITMAHFRSDAMPILNQGNIMQNLSGAKAKIMKSLEQFTKEGSGWRLKRCIVLHLGIVQYRPFRGRSYIKTPSYIPPQTVINVKNNDNRCFKWAVLSALYPVDYRQHLYRPASYMGHLGELNFTDVSFPVKVSDVTKFKRQNPDLSVNIFGWKSGLYPLHVSKQVGREIDLLLLTDPEEPEKTHYVWIKDLARMLYKNNRHKERKYPCRRCLHVFSSEALLETHKNDSQGIGGKPQCTVGPKEGQNILKFTNHHKQMQAPYIIYADFEALNIPVEGCADNPQKTRQIAKQVPCSYCYVVFRSDGVVKAPVLYRGEDAVEHFLASLQLNCLIVRTANVNTLPSLVQHTPLIRLRRRALYKFVLID